MITEIQPKLGLLKSSTYKETFILSREGWIRINPILGLRWMRFLHTYMYDFDLDLDVSEY